MIDSVPLIQNANDAQQINASIIAMKKASRELDEKIVKLNSLNSELDKKIALLDSGLSKEIEDRKEAINSLDVPSVGGSGKYISAISETDGKISATVSDITSSVSSGNSQPVTSGGVAEAIAPLQPIDSITSGNLQPVTSNAVYNRFSDLCFPVGITIAEEFNISYQSGGVWYDNDVWWRVFEGYYVNADYNNMYVEITVVNRGFSHGAPNVTKYIVSPLYKSTPNNALKELYRFGDACHGIRMGRDSNNHWYIDLHLKANIYQIFARGIYFKRCEKQSKVDMNNFTYVSTIGN